MGEGGAKKKQKKTSVKASHSRSSGALKSHTRQSHKQADLMACGPFVRSTIQNLPPLISMYVSYALTGCTVVRREDIFTPEIKQSTVNRLPDHSLSTIDT